jgi:hypothetical protein
MFDAFTIVRKARNSGFYLKLLNWSLSRMIPFNKPHGFKITRITENSLQTFIPYRQSNFNHIKGLHACALATLSEFTTGFLLINKLDAKKYRLIMQRLEMDYHYQGKMDSYAEFSVDDKWIETQVVEPLKVNDAVVVPCIVKITDTKGNHLTTGKVFWQVKDWQRVKTKV